MSKKKRQIEREKARLRRERDMAAHTAYAFYYAGVESLGKAYHERAKTFSDTLVNMARETIKPTV